MRLTILGRSPACPNPGGACSGYLVEEDETDLLIDCGTGIVSRLREIVDYRRVSAIIISHMHLDHFIDIIPYAYGLKLVSGLADGSRLPLLLPPNGQQILNDVTSQWKDLPDLMAQVFDIREFDPSQTLRIGDLDITFAETVHYVPCWAIRIAGKKTLVYSADSGPSDRLGAHVKGADLFLAEAALFQKRGVPGEQGHLTPGEAGEIARKAGARRLVLTHFWQEFDVEEMVRAASDTFGGPAEVAEEWKSYLV
ncbi:MAG: MBL fold metallo-hydrolase [Chloroflexi bacterium]|nr:MBL fold metallo-hydrolase [Chloroflexota bacterium]